MSRVIKLEGVGKERKKLVRAVVLALRELAHQQEPNEYTRDIAAFISLTLIAIYKTIDESVAAWEKRGYWLKADRFRLEWSWTETLGQKIQESLLKDDWTTIALTTAQVAEKLNKENLPQRNRLGTPWKGAWEKLKGKN
ncbi:MAG: hypothetical protein IBX69_07195 [Anaerolineales bacterium]|nr:hypothetical protein [Anaerolineales bacterium]